MANSYVLFDLESIKVNTRTINNKPIVFCKSITIKQREQDIASIEDWSNIIIGDPNITRNIGENGTITIEISNLLEKNGEYNVEVNTGIGLWSVILFKTITDDNGEYTTLYNIADESTNIGGTGIQGTNIEVIYKNDPTYTTNKCVNNFLENVFVNTEDYNGCMFINNGNCGLFLNISPMMFNTQHNLKDIALTNTITYIDNNIKGFAAVGVFSECINLESANIPKYLDDYFEYSSIHNEYNKRKTSRSIPTYYFYNCNNLNNITIPDGIRNIGYAAFYGCDTVETINIPESVISIETLSLVTVNRSDKRYINVNGNSANPSNIMIYEQSVGYDKLTDNNDKPTYSANDVIIKINDRDTVTLQGPLMFDNSSFVKNTSSNSEIYINCNAIKGTTLNTNNYGQQKYVGGFINTNFKTIYIGPKVTSICDFAFYNVTGTNLIINNGNVLAKNYTDNGKEGSLDTNGYGDGTYLIKTPFVNSNFNSIHVLNCASIGQYALHSLYTTELKFFEFNYKYVLNDNEYKNTTPLESLGDHAFYNSQFGSIIIPRDVNSISNTAFLQTKGSLELKCDISGYNTTLNQTERNHIGILVNSGFSEINFNYDGSIPKYILYENKSIKSIYLGNDITDIFEKAFYLCTNLTNTLSLPTNINRIDETSFIGCTFSGFTSESNKYQVGNDGMYLLTDNSSSIVLFANKHSDIQITDNTFDIDIDTVNKICGYAFAYAFSDYANSNVYAVNIPENIKKFGSNVFYNSNKITRITFFSSNIPDFNSTESADNIKVHEEASRISINTKGSFIELPLLKDVYIGYKTNVLLSESFKNYTENENIWFLHNTLRNSYTNTEPDISKITIYVYENLVDEYESSMWKPAGYTIVGIPAGVKPPPPVPPTGNDDSYDADIDDPEGEEWPNDGGNGNITEDEDHIPPVDDNSSNNEEGTNDSWIKHENNVFEIPIKQLGTPAINVYGCRLDLLTPTYLEGHEPLIMPKIIDQFGNIDFSALDYLKFNKVSNETHYGSANDNMLKLYMGDYGNNFLVVFTVTGIDKFDATTKLFTSGVEYATHRESNWLKTEIVRITKKPESDAYYVVLLCTCLKLQNKDNYNCRTAIVSVNYGSQILDSSVNSQNTESITTKIRVIQHKTELRLSNDTREINITDLPVLFCQQDEHTEFIGNFFIGFPKNFWGIGDSIENTQKLREYINDYFRILYDKEKIQIIGQVVTIDEIDYTYTFNVAPEKYANIKATGSTTGVLTKFSLCQDKLGDIHEEYYYVNFKIKNKKTTLAGGVWNISIYNIGEPAEMLNIHVIEDKTDIPSIVLFDENISVYGKRFNGTDIEEDTNALSDNVCYSIYGSPYVALNYFIPVAITDLPIVSNTFIYPEAEVVDLCVDSSCIIDCGNEDNTLFGTGGWNLFNNYRGVLTLNTNSTTQPKTIFPISSSKLKHLALSNIKYTYNKNIQNTGLYGYFKNSAAAITNCSCTKNITKINRTGFKDDSDILENTTTFLYEFNTGVSCINQIIAFQKTALYSHYLSINDNTINFTEINDSNSKIAYHDENYVRENNLCFRGTTKIIYDKFYNVLAPFYPYSEYTTKYKTNDSSEAQILVNKYQDETHVKLIGDSTATIYKNTLYTYINDEYEKITATGPTYYCTSTPGIVITTTTSAINEDNFNIYTGQAYLVTDDNNAKIDIGVDDETEEYTTISTNNEYMNISIYSNASTINLLPLYKLSTDSLTTNVHSQLTATLIQNACVNSGITLEHGLVISVIRKMDITFTPNNTSDLIVYEKINKDGSSEYYNINNEKINKNTLYTCSTSNIGYDKWVYISDSSASSFHTSIRDFYYNEVFSNGSNVVVGTFNIMSDNGTVKSIPVDKTFERGDSIYNTDGGDINKTPTITPTPFTTNSLNIGNLILSEFDKSVDQTRFRQIFLNFYYSILDNGVKTKVYADNTDGILMHLRLINNYKQEPLSLSFTATNINIFNFSFNSTSNDIFTGLQTTIPSYPAKI